MLSAFPVLRKQQVTIAPETSPAAPPAAPSTKNTFGLVAVILAGVGFLMAVIPATAGLAWLLVIPAIVFAIIGLTRKGKSKLTSIIAIIVAPIAWLIAIIVTIVSIAAGVGAIVDDAPAADAPSASSPATPDSGEKASEPGLGETITNNKGVAITFSSVTCGIAEAGQQYLTEKAKGQFCEIKYNVTNGSSEKISLWSSDVTGEIDGNSYEADGSISQFGGDYFSTDVNPGLSAEAVIYIDIPAGAALQYLVYVPQFSIFTDDVRVKL